MVANNQHPVQLYLYEFLNKKYRKSKDLENYKNGERPTFEIAFEERVKQLINEKLKTKDVQNGETITPDDISEIYRDASEDVRATHNLKTRTRGKNGEIEDYLETRRPFGYHNRV